VDKGKAAKGLIREWADVPYVPTQQYEKKNNRPYRYLAIRVRRQQETLFEDGAQVRHFAVVTNLWEMEGQSLLKWQRGKAGTIEQVHTYWSANWRLACSPVPSMGPMLPGSGYR
jgi:hypothetical protein